MLYNRLYVPVITRNFLVPLTSERDETKIGVREFYRIQATRSETVSPGLHCICDNIPETLL